MNQFIKKAIAITGVVALAACSSPLSDLEINDADLIHPRFTVDLDIRDNGAENHSVKAFIADKNGASVELKNGKVSVNEKEMKYSMLSYESSQKYKEGKNYEFLVTLPDSTTYEGHVEAAKKIKGINWPKSLDKNKAEKLRWLPKKGRDIEIILQVQDDKNNWKTVHNHHIGSENSYFLELPKYEFPENLNGKAEIIIKNTNKGSISNDFGGGHAESTVTYRKELTIK